MKKDTGSGCFAITQQLHFECHRNWKFKGPPMHNFIQGEDLVLVKNIPLSVVMASAGLANRSHTILDQMLEQHLGLMQKELSLTNVKLKYQETAIWTTVASTITTIIILPSKPI